MIRDWAAVAAAMKVRLAELDMTQAELVQRSGLAPMTIRELLHNTAERRRSPQTLAALSEALGWPTGYLQAIAEGRDPHLGLERGHRTLTITRKGGKVVTSRSLLALPGRSTWRPGNAATARSSSSVTGGG